MRSYISYCRVSTNKQEASGLGLEAQQEAVRRYIESVNGLHLAEHIEVESGKSATRPVLAAAIAACRGKRAILVIAKLDRLSRSVSFTSGLMESDIEFIACDMPAANRFMLHLMSAFAEYEREQISCRTKAALAAAKARGVALGSYGKHLAASNRAAADTFAETLRGPVMELLGKKATRLQDFADGLNAAGLQTREGSKWGPTSVRRVLCRLTLGPSIFLAH